VRSRDGEPSGSRLDLLQVKTSDPAASRSCLIIRRLYKFLYLLVGSSFSFFCIFFFFFFADSPHYRIVASTASSSHVSLPPWAPATTRRYRLPSLCRIVRCSLGTLAP